jgi:hypothetical protein
MSYSKKKHNWAHGVAQIVEQMPSKRDVLCSNPSTTKKKKQKTKKLLEYT